jgi:tripartite-type tricarboxylate transporter receptor subunit TctC
MRCKVLAGTLALVATLGWNRPAAGAEPAFPSKPINMVVPFAAGGAVDTTVRILSEEAEKVLGQKILIVNKAGAGAVEGQSFVARAKPDGYTLLAMTSSVVTNTLTKQVDYTIDSFEPVVLYCFDPEVMFVSAATPFQGLEDLIAAGKKEAVSHATPGHSTSHHLAALLLEQKAGMKFKYIHTKGATEQIPMMAGGHVQSGLAAWGEARSMVDLGKVRAIGVMADTRDPRMPNVPTFKEKGYPMNYGAWRGISAPKGTPPEVLEKLFAAFRTALEKLEVKEKFAKADYPIMLMGPKDFAAYVKTDYGNVKQILELLK